MRWLRILQPLGKIIAFFGILMSLPALVSWLHDDGLAAHYLAGGGGVLLTGGIIAVVGRRFAGELQVRHGFLLVSLIWTILPCFAAIPLLSVLPQLSFTKGYFEAASGLTASGATVLTNLDSLPPSLNFWRGEMSWLGGMGLIVLATAILPILGIGGSGVFQSEVPGPIKENKMTPQIAQTAKVLWLIYALLTALCGGAYYAAGMSGLDAVIHSFTTVGLGGFSSHDASYAYFQSPLIESVAIFFMIVAGMNFALHYTAWGKIHVKFNRRPLRFKMEWRREWGAYFRSVEWRSYILLLLSAVVIVVLFLHQRGVYDDWQSVLRYGAFNAVSIVTTTGYSNTDFGAWPLFAPIFMLLMANFTACSGSTGGGLKLMRVLIAFNQAKTERMKLVHPAAYYDNKTGIPLPQKTLVSVLFFILAYIAFAFALMLFLVATGMDFLTAFSAAVASISNTGPGLGGVGPASTYAHLSDAQVWACSVAMLFGRLELMSFIVVLHRGFWRY